MLQESCSSNKTKLKETQISPNHQRKKKGVYFSCICCWVWKHFLLFWQEYPHKWWMLRDDTHNSINVFGFGFGFGFVWNNNFMKKQKWKCRIQFMFANSNKTKNKTKPKTKQNQKQNKTNKANKLQTLVFFCLIGFASANIFGWSILNCCWIVSILFCDVLWMWEWTRRMKKIEWKDQNRKQSIILLSTRPIKVL